MSSSVLWYEAWQEVPTCNFRHAYRLCLTEFIQEHMDFPFIEAFIRGQRENFEVFTQVDSIGNGVDLI